jgi:transcription elongation factor Elf1
LNFHLRIIFFIYNIEIRMANLKDLELLLTRINQAIDQMPYWNPKRTDLKHRAQAVAVKIDEYKKSRQEMLTAVKSLKTEVTQEAVTESKTPEVATAHINDNADINGGYDMQVFRPRDTIVPDLKVEMTWGGDYDSSDAEFANRENSFFKAVDECTGILDGFLQEHSSGNFTKYRLTIEYDGKRHNEVHNLTDLDFKFAMINILEQGSELYESRSDSLLLDVIKIQFTLLHQAQTGGRGGNLHNRRKNNSTMKERQAKAISYLEIKNTDNRCLIRAAYLANELMASTKVEDKKQRNSLRRKLFRYADSSKVGGKKFTKIITQFCEANNLAFGVEDRPAEIAEAEPLANIFGKHIRIWHSGSGDMVAAYSADRPAETAVTNETTHTNENNTESRDSAAAISGEYIHLAYDDVKQHFDIILKPEAYFGGNMNNYLGCCYKCGENFSTIQQFNNHIQSCEDFKAQTGEAAIIPYETCKTCGKKLNSKKAHKCTIGCDICHKRFTIESPEDLEAVKQHNCYLEKPEIIKEAEESNEELEMPSVSRYAYYDFETYIDQTTGEHLGNLVVAAFGDPTSMMEWKRHNNVPGYENCIISQQNSTFADPKYESEAKFFIFSSFPIRDDIREQLIADGNIVFESDDCTASFVDWCLERKGLTLYAHNAAKYDNYIIYKELKRRANSHNLRVVPGTNGSQILDIEVKGSFSTIHFKDSYRVLGMPLASFNRELELNAEVKKGYFPHSFNLPSNYRYIGPFPSKDYYGYRTMKKGAQGAFDKWYNGAERGDVFDFQKEFIEYCIDDVNVLRQGCLKFREVLYKINVENGLHAHDPFASSTVAAMSMKQFMYNHLDVPIPVEKIPKTYIQSREAYEFLSFYCHKHNITDMKTFLNGEHEIIIDGVRYPVDGYSESRKEVIQYHGCYYHGHDCNRRQFINGIDFHKMKSVRARSDQIDAKLERYCHENGLTYTIVWGCEWKNELNNKEVKKFVNGLSQPVLKQISPREGYGGGRTNATQLYSKAGKDEEIYYVDYTSLYPFIYRFIPFPTQHCNLIENVDAAQFTKNYFQVKAQLGFGGPDRYLTIEEINALIDEAYKYEDTKANCPLGLVKCKINIPKHLLHSPIGAKVEINGETKLMFDNSTKIHTVPTTELYRLLDLGGEIVEIYSMYIAPEINNSMFQDFTDFFFKLKTINAGLGDIGNEEEDLPRFIEEYNKRYKYKISLADFPRGEDGKIVKRPAFKACAKVMLNSFYGKFGQDNEKYHTTIQLDGIQKVQKFFNDPNLNLEKINEIFVSEKDLVVTVKPNEGRARVSSYQNCLIASLITASARCKLYDLIHLLDGQCRNPMDSKVLYFDTDSVIFQGNASVMQKVQDNFEFGCLLGQLTYEFDNNKYMCKEFVGLGPKSYSLKLIDRQTGKENYLTKMKGFTLNAENAKSIDHKHMIDCATSYIDIAKHLGCSLAEAQNKMIEIYDLIESHKESDSLETTDPLIAQIIRDNSEFHNGMKAIEAKYRGKPVRNGTINNVMLELDEKHALKNDFLLKVDNHLVKHLPTFSHLFQKNLKNASITSVIQYKVNRIKYNKRQLHDYETDTDGSLKKICTIPWGYSSE